MVTRRKVLLIYTGGTIGMMQDPASGSLRPFDFNQLTANIPELLKFDVDLDHVSFEKPIDSSNMDPDVWRELAEIIKKNYNDADGFVILHGSDTMAYTASALSFMLEGLNKPVILTGSQLPIGVIRTDGKENLITAIEIASSYENEKPVVPEVCIYFEYELYRGNRTHKFNSEHFDAFKSPNYPVLAEAGVTIGYNRKVIRKSDEKTLTVHTALDTNIAVLKIFPGIQEKVINAVTNIKGIRAIVLETFGSGNAPSSDWFLALLEDAISRGIVILNITQCNTGSVVQGRYETSRGLQKIGVVSGHDMTVEAATTKLMYLLGKGLTGKTLREELERSIAGELTEISAPSKQTLTSH